MKEEIARLSIIGITPNGEHISIIGRIGKPYPLEGQEDIDEWACPVTLEPLYKNLHPAHGCGSFQSLCLDSCLLLDLLEGFIEKGGRLVDEDGTEFPLDAYWFKKTKNG